MATVGFVGVGVMGAPMARNVMKGGHEVRAYDLSGQALGAIVADGAVATSSPGEAASGAEVVISMLPAGRHVKQAVFGEGGIAEGIDSTALYIDMSTILPMDTDEIAAGLKARGIAMVDAPVGRTSAHAISGELLIMAGGSAADIARARPILECMGNQIVHCGDVGMGARMKIVNNYMSVALNTLSAEALVLAEASGLDVEVAREVMNGTTAGRGHFSTTYPAQVLQGNVTPGFMIDLADKDMGLALDLAGRLGVPATMGAVARQVYATAQAQGHGRDDWTRIYLTVREALAK